MIKPYLSDIINDHKTQGEWEVHSDNTVIDYKTRGERKTWLTMVINFIFSKDSDEICTMHTKINNIEIMMGSETDEIIEELFEPLAKISKRTRRKNERKWICFS